MYDFVRTPRWIAGHALALAGIIAFVNLGLWQLDRLEERRTYNATVASRLAAPAQPLAGVLEEVGGDPEALAYRRVTATGRYAPEEEVLLSPRSYQGTPGHHLLTPLETGDGTGVAVDRGWVPLELDDPPVAEAAPPSGEVAVTGVLFPPFADRRGVTGEVDLFTQPDIARYQEQVPIDLAPVYLLAQDRTGDLPVPGELPTLDEGNHLSYAVQWFVFATVVAVGYPLLLRRTARDRQRAFDDLRRETPQPAGGFRSGL